MVSRTLLAGCIVAGLALAGCGAESDSDEDQIRAVAERAAEAVADQDAAELCDVLYTVELEAALTKAGQHKSCEEVMTPQLADQTEEERSDADSFEVVTIKVDGDRAVAEVKTDDGRGEEATFRQQQGEWRLYGANVIE
jgi:hypothetical protein